MRFGHHADDVYVDVPVGTVVTEEEGGAFLADLKHEGDIVLVAKGGRGGRGNAAFKSSRNRIPKVAENGFPGERKRLIPRAKTSGGCWLNWFPERGQITLLNIVSKANVPTADYPFTTLGPEPRRRDLKRRQPVCFRRYARAHRRGP
jgi:GTP-binding protein